MKKIFTLLLVFAICIASATAIAETDKNGSNYSQIIKNISDKTTSSFFINFVDYKDKTTENFAKHIVINKNSNLNTKLENKKENKTVEKAYDEIQAIANTIRTEGPIQTLFENLLPIDIITALSANNAQEALNLYIEAYNTVDGYETRLSLQKKIEEKYDALIKDILHRKIIRTIYTTHGENEYIQIKNLLKDQKTKDRIVSAWTDAYVASHMKKIIEYKLAIDLINRYGSMEESKIDANIETILIRLINNNVNIGRGQITRPKKEDKPTDNEKDFATELEKFINNYIDEHGNNDMANNLLSQIEIIKYGHIIGE